MLNNVVIFKASFEECYAKHHNTKGAVIYKSRAVELADIIVNKMKGE
jgi:hypothetical protein